jgi:hypothetical protein
MSIEITSRIEKLLRDFCQHDVKMHKRYGWIKLHVQSILEQIYDDSFFREYPVYNTFYIYFSEIRDDNKISEDKKYVVAQFTNEEKDDNEKNAFQLVSLLKDEISKIDLSKQMKEYTRIANEFNECKNNLETSLLEVKYSTNLKFAGDCPFLKE